MSWSRQPVVLIIAASSPELVSDTPGGNTFFRVGCTADSIDLAGAAGD